MPSVPKTIRVEADMIPGWGKLNWHESRWSQYNKKGELEFGSGGSEAGSDTTYVLPGCPENDFAIFSFLIDM